MTSASIFTHAIPAWLQHTLGHTFLAGEGGHCRVGWGGGGVGGVEGGVGGG